MLECIHYNNLCSVNSVCQSAFRLAIWTKLRFQALWRMCCDKFTLKKKFKKWNLKVNDAICYVGLTFQYILSSISTHFFVRGTVGQRARIVSIFHFEYSLIFNWYLIRRFRPSSQDWNNNNHVIEHLWNIVSRRSRAWLARAKVSECQGSVHVQLSACMLSGWGNFYHLVVTS